MPNRLVAIDAWLLKLPLTRPYKLSFGPVAELDTVFVRATLANGASGWGEATLLTGYTDETIAGTWARVVELLGSPPSGATLHDQVERWIGRLDASHPFLTTAFRTAAEMANGSPYLNAGGTEQAPLRVPVLGLLQSEDAARLRDEADELIAAGYRTVKLKVGFDPLRDALNVAAAQRALAGRAALRLDANQGFDAAEACAFVERVDPAGIELFEQPCAAGDWQAHAQVVRVADARGLPLMLDESIYSLREIEHAAQAKAARFIKVKLMKFNSLARLDAALALIVELGMTPVLGNGVANELGCWMEACIAARRIDNAGEMNGFLKPRDRLFERPLRFRDGAIELVVGEQRSLDCARLQRLALAHARCEPT